MIVDVLSRSRVYLDEMYEVLASAVEAARPKASQARFIVPKFSLLIPIT